MTQAPNIPPNAIPSTPPQRPPDRELTFKKTPQADLKLFLYLPPDWQPQNRRPAILFFFGGGWRVGNPAQFFSQAEYLASRGIVAISAQYRIESLHQTSLTDCVLDSRSAIRYLREHSTELGIDPNKIIASGGSAGGHLAAALALLNAPNEPTENPTIPCRPNALVLFNPVLDLGHPPARDSPEKNIAWDRIPGNSFDERAKTLEALCPLRNLAPHCPPAILFFGSNDQFLPGARGFQKKSRTLHNLIETWIAPDLPHGFFNREPWRSATLRKTDEFLTALGYLIGPPTLQSTATLVLDP